VLSYAEEEEEEDANDCLVVMGKKY